MCSAKMIVFPGENGIGGLQLEKYQGLSGIHGVQLRNTILFDALKSQIQTAQSTFGALSKLI